MYSNQLLTDYKVLRIATITVWHVSAAQLVSTCLSVHVRLLMNAEREGVKVDWSWLVLGRSLGRERETDGSRLKWSICHLWLLLELVKCCSSN